MALFLAVAVAAVLVPSWPAQQAAPWPREGSTVEYELRSSFTVPDGSYHEETTARLRLAFDGARWTGTCSGQAREVLDGSPTTSTWSMASGGQPILAPAGMRRAATVPATLTQGADVAEALRQMGTDLLVVGPGRHATAMEDDRGRTLRRNAWTAEELPETSAYQDLAAAWDRETGLLLDWTRVGSMSTSGVRLVASDAF